MGILELQNLTYSYDKKRKVLRGINAQMEAGKIKPELWWIQSKGRIL